MLMVVVEIESWAYSSLVPVKKFDKNMHHLVECSDAFGYANAVQKLLPPSGHAYPASQLFESHTDNRSIFLGVIVMGKDNPNTNTRITAPPLSNDNRISDDWLRRSSAHLQREKGTRPGFHWRHLSNVFRPIFSGFSLAICLVMRAIQFAGFLVGEVFGGIFAFVGYCFGMQWLKKYRDIGVRFYDWMEAPSSLYAQEARLGFASLIAVLFAAIQALVIFACLHTFLLGTSAVAVSVLPVIGASMVLPVCAFLAFNTGVVNYALARGFLLNLAQGRIKGIPFSKLSHGHTLRIALLLLGGAFCTVGAAALSAGLVYHTLMHLSLLASLGPIGLAVPAVGAMATAIVYSVFFFGEVFNAIREYAESLAHPSKTADNRKPLMPGKSKAQQSTAPSKSPFLFGVLFTAFSVMGLFLYTYVGFGDMVNSVHIPYKLAMFFAALNLTGGFYFFSKAGYTFGEWFGKLLDTIREHCSPEGMEAAWKASFHGKKHWGNALYVHDDAPGLWFAYKNGRYTPVSGGALPKGMSLDTNGFALLEDSGARIVWRYGIFILDIATLGLVVATFVGVPIMAGLPLMAWLAVAALKQTARWVDNLQQKNSLGHLSKEVKLSDADEAALSEKAQRDFEVRLDEGLLTSIDRGLATNVLDHQDNTSEFDMKMQAFRQVEIRNKPDWGALDAPNRLVLLRAGVDAKNTNEAQDGCLFRNFMPPKAQSDNKQFADRFDACKLRDALGCPEPSQDASVSAISNAPDEGAEAVGRAYMRYVCDPAKQAKRRERMQAQACFKYLMVLLPTDLERPANVLGNGAGNGLLIGGQMQTSWDIFVYTLFTAMASIFATGQKNASGHDYVLLRPEEVAIQSRLSELANNPPMAV